ncbi:hypothetical protein PGT21_010309 [Puccinia graminis f. sp. tritici]|uniref:DDE Tnp4 domain-containing protein n=1 Tax=Puccinia graminis f. sp. tritici TaxID=56615 RepID=A0A5B0MEN2_PUCGR|nr:hypothetical protein PGT21_010309 [Puccinia graminis f. sp. tritici]
MGLDVRTFDDLLDRFLARWNYTTIDRADVNPTGEPQLGRRSLDAAGALGLVLHWLCSTMSSYTLQQLFGVTPAVCSRYLASGMQHLLAVLQEHPQARFLWPTTDRRAQQYSAPIEKKYPLLTRCFGFLDGLNLPVLVSDNEDVQNAYYNGWTCSHYCSCILAFTPDGTIMYAILNAPGSWHNATIAEPLYEQLLERTPPGYRIISDMAFPRKSERIQARILAPAKRGDRLPRESVEFARLQLLNEQLFSARQAAQWGMRSIQGSFGRLKMPLPATDHQYQADLLQIACRLHQLRCRSVGINQTATVYQSVWDDNNLLCRDFHRMLFADIQGQCHISRYYDGWL